MTTKQIAEAVGRPERTVKGWATKAGARLASAGAKLASAGHGRAADWDLEESCLIIEIGLGKNAASLFRENAKQKAPETIAEIVKATMTAFIPVIIAAVRGVAVTEGMPALTHPAISAPPIETRDELRRIINRATRDSGDYSGAWNRLYEEAYYRLHVNLRERAKNQGIPIIDYAEAEGFLPELVAIAREIFKAAA